MEYNQIKTSKDVWEYCFETYLEETNLDKQQVAILQSFVEEVWLETKDMQKVVNNLISFCDKVYGIFIE